MNRVWIKQLYILIAFCSYCIPYRAVAEQFYETESAFIILTNEYESALFNHFPELAMYYGRTDLPTDRLIDHSLNAISSWQAMEDEFLIRLSKLNEKSLTTNSYHTYQLLKQTLLANQAARVCKEELWNINPQDGWQATLSMMAEKQIIGTPKDRKMAFKKWQTFSKIIDDEISNLKTGVKLGYLAPKPIVKRVLQQLAIITDGPIEASPYFEFAKRDGNVEFKKEIAQLLLNQINPAIKRYATYLETEYLPLAREEIGVSALPNGIQCYQAKIVKETTLSLPAEVIYQFGLSHMRQLKEEVAMIGKEEFSSSNMQQIFLAAKNKTSHLFHSEKEMLDYNQAALDRAAKKMPNWFKTIPADKGSIRPYPLHLAQTGSPGEYHPPSDDGLRPGIFYINTYEPQKRSRIDQEATLFHELIPGHHYQTILAYADNSHPHLNQYLWNAGFDEGWGLYVERLADEMGLYSDNISRIGMLSNESLRTARLVVDPGIHVFNWTRERAVEYLTLHTAMDQDMIEAEVDRYIMSPGQATTYMIGKREIDDLRQLAQKKLGDKFEIREFHHQLLKNGPITLPMLRVQMTEWMSATTVS